jgi:hypothetical protein
MMSVSVATESPQKGWGSQGDHWAEFLGLRDLLH